MSERKAINKYYPPDFDPSKVPKKKGAKKTGPASWPTVRLMTPFSLRCTSCGEYISKSKKFNARKETTDESYFGVKVLRFHIRCPQCFADIVFRTDPKTADFETVSGAVRNYAPKKTAEEEAAKEESLEETLKRLEREEKLEQMEEAGQTEETALEQLERRLGEQQREQELADELEELREKNLRREDANGDNKLILKAASMIQSKREREEEEDEREAREAFEKKRLVEQRITKVKIPAKKKNKLGIVIKKKT